MSLLHRLEAALERIAEGGAERVFGGRLDLVAVGQELYNAAVENPRHTADGPLVPNAYDVHLALDDYGHFSHEVEALQAKYAVALWSRLREGDYGLTAPPGVLITPQEGLAAGAFRIEPAFTAVAPAFTLSNSSARGAVYRLRAPATIGRSTECDLHLDSASISRHHARVEWDWNCFVVADLGSRNGTRVNGAAISRAPLESGDVVAFGDVPLRFVPEIAPAPVVT